MKKSRSKYTLGNGVKMNAAHPDTFYIPSDADKAQLAVGDLAKLIFCPIDEEEGAERMWVEITDIDGDDMIGRLDNEPFWMDCPSYGDTIKFRAKHIINITAIDHTKSGNPYPVDPTGNLTIGGIPDADLDRMIAATAQPEEAEPRSSGLICRISNRPDRESTALPLAGVTEFVAGKMGNTADLFNSAMAAGRAAALNVKPVPAAGMPTASSVHHVEREGICGHADVIVRPGSPHYDSLNGRVKGHFIVLDPPSDLGQSYERYAAWAHAMVAVLIPAGVDAEARVWID